MTTLILGATSPIARELAARYAADGDAVFVAARDDEEVRRIASDLSIRHRAQIRGGTFDALDTGSHAAFLDEVEAELGPVEVAVLAFGAMGEQERSQEQISAARRVIDTNYTGAVSVCELLAERMSARGRGAIVGISSVAGERGRKSNYIYGSAKGAFTLYLGGLRNRLASEGVNVLTVKLGFVDTRMTFGLDSPIPKATPEDTARAIHAAQRRGQDVLWYPRFWAPIMGVIKSIPERFFKKMSI